MASHVPSPPYPRPPIVEAVIGFHFTQPLDGRVLDRFVKTNAKKYPAQERLFDLSFTATDRKGTKTAKPNGYRIRDADSAVVLVMRPETISVVRAAPYTSWENLIACAKDVWGKLKKVGGHPELSRLSTRYINRIDIKSPPPYTAPSDQPLGVSIATYVKAGIVLPTALQQCPLVGFQMVCHLQGPDDHFTRVLQLRTEQSPLIDHVALVLDIDVATNDPVPMRDQDIWALAGELRVVKNSVFEASITDETRRLFA
jgi:uncharacterized protein (TIGR04255 family)